MSAFGNAVVVRVALLLMAIVITAACQGEADLDPTVGNTGESTGPVAPTSPASGTRLTTGELPTGTTYLADSTQRPLYVRVESVADCDAVCESVWPPVGATDPPAEAGVPTVLSRMIGSVLREDGRLQVTYNGHPLHYHVAPDQPEVPRERLQDRWGEWALIAPTGAPLGQ